MANFSKHLPLSFNSCTSICTEYPTILRSLSFYLLAGTRVCVHQHKIHSFLGILCTKLSSLCQKARFFSLCLGSVDAYPTTKLTAWYCPNISKRIDIRRSLTPSLVNLDVLHIDILTAKATLYRTAVEHAVPCCCCRDCPPWSSRFLNPQHRYVFCCCLVQHDLIPPIAVGFLYRQAPDIVSCYLSQCRFLPLPS